jgi:damage-control phosphatase, subfamily I
MRFQPLCIDCAKRQGVRVFRLAMQGSHQSNPDGREDQFLLKLENSLHAANPELSPAELSLIAIKTAENFSESADPFVSLKKKSNELAETLYPELKKLISLSENPLFTACQLAACGNIIDLGIFEQFDIHQTIDRVLRNGFRRNDFSLFQDYLEHADRQKAKIQILYLCDNAGEIVFDRLLIEILLHRYPQLVITAVVNSDPVLNDATLEDAHAVGLDQIVEVIEDGTGELGIVFSKVNSRFMAVYEASDLIISKGQANYETLSPRPENIYFILQAKCAVIAAALGVSLYDAVMISTPINNTNLIKIIY